MRTLTILTLLAAVAVAAARPAGSGERHVELTPHLAVYDLSLERAAPSSGIDDFRGRLVFEARGSGCAGFWGDTRFVGQVVGEQGSMFTDTRSATHESADGDRFSFATERYSGHELVEETEGKAHREPEHVSVELERPDEGLVRLPRDVVFPSQHMRMILEAAREGRRILEAKVYDGSETGRIVYDTTAIIGDSRPPMTEEAAAEVSGNASELLADWTSWPVTVGYFDAKGENPELPAYEFSYDLFGNGISRAIRLDYGDFVLAGRLVSLRLGDTPPCDL